jgi:hypothetical protein
LPISIRNCLIGSNRGGDAVVKDFSHKLEYWPRRRAAGCSPARPHREGGKHVGGALAAQMLEAPASEGAFRHLRVLQDIASVSSGNRAAGTSGYDRSAEYVAERLKEAGYRVHFEEFEFPFFEERVPPVLLASSLDGRQEPAPAAALRTLANSGSSNVIARLRAVSLGLAEGPPLASASAAKPPTSRNSNAALWR